MTIVYSLLIQNNVESSGKFSVFIVIAVAAAGVVFVVAVDFVDYFVVVGNTIFVVVVNIAVNFIIFVRFFQFLFCHSQLFDLPLLLSQFSLELLDKPFIIFLGAQLFCFSLLLRLFDALLPRSMTLLFKLMT